MKKNSSLSETQINTLFAKKLRKENYIVLNELRLTSAEFDLVILEPSSLSLINIEIKKDRWQKLFYQARRGKLYCHYSIVAMPFTAKNNISIESFSDEGIGVIFYQEKKNDLKLYFEVEPQLSTVINRDFKKSMYKRITSQYGDLIYA